ncbi:D-serine ammonia-lyase [Ascochyta rabiei]|uniref:D-serine ammonia-lyase n=1 Tax=Didymella rabiei TaxID=5454 RepID=UPI0021FE99F1|nr:D-serine ammonia-lyase [Ascochyta rabiei]UPX19235.1 D-serine ammonia-lyase [Ascochyta rabiei]
MAAGYPLSDLASLRAQFVGRKLTELPSPSIILDRSLVEKNCAAMLQICSRLGLGFRAHVKSHKTLELARLMVGDGLQGVHGRGAQFIVSTVAEAENLAPYVQQCQEQGREASVCHAFMFNAVCSADDDEG